VPAMPDLGRVFHFAGVSVSTFELGKKFEEFRVTEVRFLCEQDGPPERLLKDALSRVFAKISRTLQASTSRPSSDLL